MFNQQSNIGLFFFFFLLKLGRSFRDPFAWIQAQVEMLLFYLEDFGPRNNVCRWYFLLLTS